MHVRGRLALAMPVRSLALLALLAALAGCSSPAAPAPTETRLAYTVRGFPAGPLVVFTAGGALHLAAPDGGNDVALLKGAIIGEQLHPDWSPDGDSITFVADSTDGTRDLWVAPSGGELTKLVDCVDPCVWVDDPAWSPDGKTIAFHRGVAGAGNIGIATLEIVPVNGGEPKVLATLAPSNYPFAPRWAPDGKHIVSEVVTFASTDVLEDKVTSNRLAIFNLDDGSVFDLPGAPTGAGTPDWSPDGTRILFTAPDAAAPAYSDLWWIPPTGGTPTQLTHIAATPARALLGSFTPDGTAVIFDYEKRLNDPTSAFVSTVPVDGGDVVVGFAGTHPRLRP